MRDAGIAVPQPDLRYPRLARWSGQPRSKTVVDIVLSLIVLTLLSPFLLVVAILVKITSRGPIIYRQERIGLHGAPFTILKFRTMTDGADHHLSDLLLHHGRHESPLFKIPNDPRITKVGRVLRKFSLDEFPQLVNVIRGDMSLVGPRPQRAKEVALHDDFAHQRLLVKPGVTGMWQVHGRSDLPWEEAVKLDVGYVNNRNGLLDAKILAKTILVVIGAHGAR